ncbi:MAG: hypothetical protein ACFBSD_01470 [Paracoccaceae bacterium]
MRIAALLFLGLALVVLGIDLWPLIAGGEASEEAGFRLSALGEWWYTLHPDSLQLLQPAIERHITPYLWDPVILSLLEAPLAVEFAVLAGLCWVMRRRTRD